VSRYKRLDRFMRRVSLLSPALILVVSLVLLILHEDIWSVWTMLLAILTQLFNLGNIQLRLVKREDLVPPLTSMEEWDEDE
jgi:hypothetical protein